MCSSLRPGDPALFIGNRAKLRSLQKKSEESGARGRQGGRERKKTEAQREEAGERTLRQRK